MIPSIGIMKPVLKMGASAPPVCENVATRGSGSNSTTVSIAYPSGIQAGDLLVLHISVRETTASLSTPSGFTHLQTIDSAKGISGSVFYKIASGSESGSISVTRSSAPNVMLGMMHRVSNVNASNPINLSNIATNASGGPVGQASYSLIGLTTESINSMVFSCINYNNDYYMYVAYFTSGDWDYYDYNDSTVGSDIGMLAPWIQVEEIGAINAGNLYAPSSGYFSEICFEIHGK